MYVSIWLHDESEIERVKIHPDNIGVTIWLKDSNSIFFSVEMIPVLDQLLANLELAKSKKETTDASTH